MPPKKPPTTKPPLKKKKPYNKIMQKQQQIVNVYNNKPPRAVRKSKIDKQPKIILNTVEPFKYPTPNTINKDKPRNYILEDELSQQKEFLKNKIRTARKLSEELRRERDSEDMPRKQRKVEEDEDDL